MTSEVLKQLEHGVDWTLSANQAFEALSCENRFGAVLLDLGLGGDDAVSLIDALRERGSSLPPLMIFSAQPVETLRFGARATGAAEILHKSRTSGEMNAAFMRAVSR